MIWKVGKNIFLVYAGIMLLVFWTLGPVLTIRAYAEEPTGAGLFWVIFFVGSWAYVAWKLFHKEGVRVDGTPRRHKLDGSRMTPTPESPPFRPSASIASNGPIHAGSSRARVSRTRSLPGRASSNTSSSNGQEAMVSGPSWLADARALIETANRSFEAERNDGFRDRVVVGGLTGFAETFARRLASETEEPQLSDDAEHVRRLLADYGNLDRSTRAARIAQAAELLDDPLAAQIVDHHDESASLAVFHQVALGHFTTKH